MLYNMSDFIDKKEKLADLLEEYNEDKSKIDELREYAQQIKDDTDFKNRDLFTKILNDIFLYINELSHKEIKQRIMMIRNYLD